MTLVKKGSVDKLINHLRRCYPAGTSFATGPAAGARLLDLTEALVRGKRREGRCGRNKRERIERELREKRREREERCHVQLPKKKAHLINFIFPINLISCLFF